MRSTHSKVCNAFAYRQFYVQVKGLYRSLPRMRVNCIEETLMSMKRQRICEQHTMSREMRCSSRCMVYRGSVSVWNKVGV